MRSGKWWPWAVAWILAAATTAVSVSAGVRVAGAGSLSPTEIRDWAVAVFALGASVLAAFRWASKKTHDPPERLPWERISTAKRFLANAANAYWKKESQYRDWERRPLMQVRWRAPVEPQVPSHSGAVKNPPQTASSAEIAELAENFRACEPRRLVILGGPGAGKTTLAVRLLLELLATREGREDEPVPVILPVAQWDAGKYPRLQAWLTEQLYEDYPGLRWLGIDGVRQMVDLGHVLPILDGLDELPEAAQTTVIRRLNDSLGRDGQLILTSRTTEYIDAVGGGRALEAATVLEALPVTPLAAADYVKRSLQSHQADQPAWATALEALRTGSDSALAEIAKTPLGLWLLRTVYITGDGDPDELTDPARFPTSDKLRAHLFDRLIAVLLPPDGDKDRAKSLGLSRGYQADDAERWLGFLAQHLSNQPSQHDPNLHGTRDFEWWRLAATTGRKPTRRVLGLVWGLALALVGGLTDGLMSGNLSGAVYGSVVGLVWGLGLAVFGVNPTVRWVDEPPGITDLRGLRGRRVFRSAFRAGRGSGLGAGLVIGLVIGLVVGLGDGLADLLETPSPAAEVTSPQESLRLDRTLNLARIISFCLGFGSVHSFGLWAVAGLGDGLWCGVVLGFLSGRHRAWLAYVWATWQLFREGKLPRKLMPFLADMHRLGLLRAVGRIYQFRHAELQDHLAAAYRRAG